MTTTATRTRPVPLPTPGGASATFDPVKAWGDRRLARISYAYGPSAERQTRTVASVAVSDSSTGAAQFLRAGSTIGEARDTAARLAGASRLGQAFAVLEAADGQFWVAGLGERGTDGTPVAHSIDWPWMETEGTKVDVGRTQGDVVAVVGARTWVNFDHQNPPPTGNLSGTVKWWSSEKGFGFISQPDGPDVFVHYSGLDRPDGGYATLEEGQSVHFDLLDGPKGPQAGHVTVDD